MKLPWGNTIMYLFPNPKALHFSNCKCSMLEKKFDGRCGTWKAAIRMRRLNFGRMMSAMPWPATGRVVSSSPSMTLNLPDGKGM